MSEIRASLSIQPLGVCHWGTPRREREQTAWQMKWTVELEVEGVDACVPSSPPVQNLLLLSHGCRDNKAPKTSRSRTALTEKKGRVISLQTVRGAESTGFARALFWKRGESKARGKRRFPFPGLHWFMVSSSCQKHVEWEVHISRTYGQQWRLWSIRNQGLWVITAFMIVPLLALLFHSKGAE